VIDPEFTLAMITHGLRRPEQREMALKSYCRQLFQPRTCDGCRFWKEVSGPETPEPFGMCRNCATNRWHTGYAYDPSKLWQDDEDEHWGVGTSPKFGCVHWEAKPVEEPPAQLPPTAG